MSALKDASMYDSEVVSRLLGIPYDEEELVTLPDRPPAVPGHLCFFDPGWSILILRDAVSDKGTIFFQQHWYDNEPFADFGERPQYHQLRMEPDKESFGKTFKEQQALIPPGMEIPRARVVLMGMAIHFLATGQRLFGEVVLRCNDKDRGDGRVIAGGFDRDGFNLFSRPDTFRISRLGLVSSRKI